VRPAACNSGATPALQMSSIPPAPGRCSAAARGASIVRAVRAVPACPKSSGRPAQKESPAECHDSEAFPDETAKSAKEKALVRQRNASEPLSLLCVESNKRWECPVHSGTRATRRRLNSRTGSIPRGHPRPAFSFGPRSSLPRVERGCLSRPARTTRSSPSSNSVPALDPRLEGGPPVMQLNRRSAPHILETNRT